MSSTDKPLIQLPPNLLNAQDYVSARHDALIPAGVQPKDLMNPAFWAHHAVKLKPWDEIRARAEDGTWIGMYLVLDCSRVWARVHELSMHRLTDRGVAETQASEADVEAFIAQHKISHNQESKWRVVRTSDKAVVHDQLGTRDAAQAWLDTFARQQVGAPLKAAPAAVATT